MQITTLNSFAYFYDIWFSEKVDEIENLKNVFPDSVQALNEVLRLLEEKPINPEFHINVNWSNIN